MRKLTVSFINLLAVTASLAVFAVPVASAQTATTCPAGYTCTVIPTTPGCPVGYTCTPTTDNGGSSAGGGGGGGVPVTNPVSDATVTINGAPTLALTYDSSNKEASLTANFDINVTGGTRTLYLVSGAPVNFISSKNTQYGNGSVTPVGFASSTNSTNYGLVYVIAPGQSVHFKITSSILPSQMFAGTYYASLVGLRGTSNLNDTTYGNTIVVVPANQTNSKTIIGERSPYISSINGTQPFVPGQTLSIVGERLNTSGGVFVDGTRISSPLRGDDARNISATLPTTIADGYHTLQIVSSTNGASNGFGFQTQSSNGTCYTFSTNLTIGSTGPDVVALQNWLLAHGFHMSAIESGRQPKGYYGNQTGDAVAAYQATVGIRERLNGYGYFGPITRAKVNASCTTTVPPVTVNCPVGYICSTPSSPAVCPAGYVCTVAYANCPDGYTCYTATAVNTGTSGGGGYQFSVNLNLGSTGPDVVALQTWLIANGYNIPNIASGSTAKGYYDSQTAAAVLQFQNAVGINESGVGPITRAKLNGGTVSTAVCPPGYVCTTPTTNPPVNNNSIAFQAVFNKTFNLSTVPSVVTLAVAADNNYLAYVNGQYVGTGRSEAAGQGNNNFDNLTNYNISQYLHTGSNTISITGQNYYSTAPSWPDNAFGLLYKVTDPNGNILAASDGTETIGTATIAGGSSVVLSQPHQWYIRPSGASWIWDSADPLYKTYLTYIGQGNTAQTAIRVISPNGGEQWQAYKSYVASWTPMSSGDVTIYLNDVNGNGCLLAQASAAAGSSPVSITTENCPNSAIKSISNGQYKISVTYSQNGLWKSNDTSDGYITISGALSTGQAPVISGSSAPTTLTVGQTGTWSVTASDPNNGTLSYSVNWGDNNCPTGYVCSNTSAAPSPVQQSSTFTHSYATAGTYTVTIMVTNSAGLTAKTTSSITVTGGIVTPPSQASISASVIDASSDKAGIWNVFGPGAGRVNGNNPYDWHVSGTLSNAAGKTISYATMIMNGIREGWSTSASSNNAFGVQLYPLVMSIPGFLTSSADQTYAVQSNSTSINFYAQPEDAVGTTFRGATLTIGFTDGTSITTQIPASSVAIPAAGTQGPSVAISLDANSPLSSTVQISTSAQTQNVPLVTFDLKSQNAPTNLQTVTATVNTTGQQVASIFSNLTMRIGGQTFSAQTITNGNSNSATATFSNFGSVALPANTVMPVTIFGTIQQDTTGSLSGSSASVSVGSGVTAQDTNYNNVPVSGSAAGNQITFTSAGVMLSNPTVTLGTAIMNPTTGSTTYNSSSFSFMLTAGNNPIYVANNSNIVQVASIGSGYFNIVNVTASGSGPDTSSYFYVAPGQSRTFTVIGVLGGAGTGGAQVNAVYYGTSPSSLQGSSITQGLQSLRLIGQLSLANSSASLTASIWDAIRAYYAH